MWDEVTLSEPLAEYSQSLIDFTVAVKAFVEANGGQLAREMMAETLGAAAHSRDMTAGFAQAMDDAQKHWNKAEPTSQAMADLDANSFVPLAASARNVIESLDAALKNATNLAKHCEKERNAPKHDSWDKRKIAGLLKEVGVAGDLATDRLRRVGYFRKQLHWLLHRFPDGVFVDVPGLCKAVSREEIEAADWSLTPGRYVGVAPEEVDEDFDFPQAMKDIHTELAELDLEAGELAKRIQENFEGLGV